MGKTKKIVYVVYGSKNGTRVNLFKTESRKEAIEFYKKHKKAIGIQKYENGVPSGCFQPGVPSKITYRGKKYTRAFHGAHTKREAESLAKSLRERGLKCIIRKFPKDNPKGWFIFVRD